MSKSLIELITNESGDYEVLRMNLGEEYIYSNHAIPNHEWIKLLKTLGYKVEEKEISDEDMENENY